MIMVFGEITTKAKVDYEEVVRKVAEEIGFTSAAVGLDSKTCKVLVQLEEQSPDIGQGVHGMGSKRPEDIGAGDQGHMFGYATDETPELMPLTHVLATQLGYRLTEVRKNGTVPWLRPDGKTQVTVEYKNDKGAMIPIRVHTILISTQHNEDVSQWGGDGVGGGIARMRACCCGSGAWGPRYLAPGDPTRGTRTPA